MNYDILFILYIKEQSFNSFGTMIYFNLFIFLILFIDGLSLSEKNCSSELCENGGTCLIDDDNNTNTNNNVSQYVCIQLERKAFLASV